MDSLDFYIETKSKEKYFDIQLSKMQVDNSQFVIPLLGGD